MKIKIIVGSLLVMLLVIFVLGCTERLPCEEVDQVSILQLKSADPVWVYYKDGIIETNPDSLKDFKIAFFDFGSYKVFVFTNDVHFNEWAADFYAESMKIDMAQVNRNINLISDYAFASGADIFYDQHGYISSDMLDFMYAHGLPANTRNVIRILWDDINFQNQIHFSGLIPIPSLGNSRNRAESLQQMGILALNAYFDKTWWRGSRIFVFNVTPSLVAIPDLGVLSFRNRIESILPII